MQRIKIDPKDIIVDKELWKFIDRELVESLKESLKRGKSIGNPIINKTKELIAGKHRLLAHIELGHKEIEVDVDESTDEVDNLRTSLEENLQRRQEGNLFLEHGYRFSKILKEKNISLRKLAKEVGLNREYLSRCKMIYEHCFEELVNYQLSQRCDTLKGKKEERRKIEELKEKLLTIGFIGAYEIARTWTWTTEEERLKLINNCLEGEWSVRELRKVIIKTREAKQIINTIDDEKIEKEILDRFGDLFFTPELDNDELIYEIELRESGSPKTKTIRIPADNLTEQEAKNLAVECHGAYVGKETKTYYILEISPTAFKRKKRKYGL